MKRLVIILFLLGATIARAESLAEAKTRLLRDIAAAEEQLAERKAAIQTAREKLFQDLRERQDRVRKLREEAARLDTARTARHEAEAASRRKAAERTAMLAAATDFRRQLEANMTLAESQRFLPRLDSIDKELASSDPDTQRQSVASAIHLGRDLLVGRMDVSNWSGRALAPDRSVLAGRFIQAGPITWFAGGDVAGPVYDVAEEGLPVVKPSANPEPIRQLAAGPSDIPVHEQVMVRVDLNTTPASVAPSLIAHLKAGGVTMIPLLLVAVVCLFLAAAKLLSLARLGTRDATGSIGEILQSLAHGQTEVALAAARRLPKPLGPVLVEGVQHRDAPKEHLEEILYERILAQVPSLERWLTPLAVGASIAPLLGLLGTVTGMIHTFRLITVFGTGDPKILSGGISEALITTEVGLAIAIPTLLVHAFLSRRVRRAVASTQQAAIMFVNGLKLRNGGHRDA